ncbi:MAG TPA: HAMP domain-containing protein, partial [Terriglobales bacterium]|nr:HAMP domain-containing protein [Terriglobales bacterium]
MTIKKKLYLNFAAILCIMVGLFLVSMYGIRRERNAKAAAAATEQLRFQMMQNRLTLANYLLSGDTRELDKLHDGTVALSDLVRQAEEKTSDKEQLSALAKLDNMETDWNSKFAAKMIEKRKEVDAGNATVADLQIAYLQADPVTWLKNSNDVMVQVQEDRQKADETATIVTSIFSFMFLLFAIAMGGFIAFRTSLSITKPLSQLMSVAREIGESGDLEHSIETNGKDEIGELARSFAQMVGYLKEMAAVSEAIARGDLTVEVEPRSKRDTLGSAFTRMLDGLRSIVRSVRDAAAQVA